MKSPKKYEITVHAIIDDDDALLALLRALHALGLTLYQVGPVPEES